MGEPNLAQTGPVDVNVMMAAQEMAEAVRGKLSDDSPLGKLVGFSKSISEVWRERGREGGEGEGRGGGGERGGGDGGGGEGQALRRLSSPTTLLLANS